MALSLLCTTLSAEITETITFSELGIESGDEVEKVEGKYVTLTVTYNSSYSKRVCYYDKGEGIRIYTNDSITFKSDYNMTKMEFTFYTSSKNLPDADVPDEANFAYSTGSYDYDEYTWTGNTTELTIVRSPESGYFVLQSVTITYDETSVDDSETQDSDDENADDGTSDDGTSDEEGQGSDDENADDGSSDDTDSEGETQDSDDENAVVDSTKYYLSGDINDWDASATPFGDVDEEGIHTLSLDTLYGEFNVTTNGTWDVCYGTTGSTLFTDSTECVLEETTNNRCVTVDGTYSDCVISLKANADGTLTLYMTVNNDSSDNVEAAVSNVKTAVTSVADNDVYNLNGQRVDSQTKGILIRNGKKYVNR